MAKKITIYTFYNNKGGVVKTTLCFNAATLYAQKYPKTQVLVIDMCPQANISQYLLGGGNKGYNTNQKLQSSSTRKNIVGFIDWLLRGNSNFGSPSTSYKTKVSPYNILANQNLYLIAGDAFLESLTLAINYAVINPANIKAWKEYMTSIRRLCDFEFDEKEYERLVVFIDCNPSFSIYTQMALVSSDFLIIPMMADFSSIEGAKGILMLLYGKYPSAALKRYAENVITFNKQVHAFDLDLPKIYGFVFNSFTTKEGIAAAFDAVKNALIDFCYEQFTKFPDLFSEHDNIKNINDWERRFIWDVKDFHSAGKVSASLGIPIFQLPNQTVYTMPDNSEVKLPKGNYAGTLKDIDNFVSAIK